MAVEAPVKLITAEEFAQWPDDGPPRELVDGMVITMPPPGKIHARIVGTIVAILSAWVRSIGVGIVYAGDTGYVLRREPDTVRGADVSYVARNVDFDDESAGYGEGAPDLAVEVLSPNSRTGEVLRKVGEYLDAGARLVWVVDPKTRNVTAFGGVGQVRVYGLKDTLDGGDVLPGFSCAVTEIFR